MASTAPPGSSSVPTADAQELGRLRAAHQDLLRAISHDLRAPVRHITAFTPLLREIVEPSALLAAERAEALEFLATIEQAGQRMGRMIDALLALSRIQAAALRVEAVDLDRLLPQVVDELTPSAAGRSMDWRLGPGLGVVQADEALLRQLIKELLANAIKFTRNTAAPCIAVRTVRSADGEATGAWALQVQDNGAGFDAAQAQGLFGLFQRLHPEREFEGVGAGLAIVQAIAQRHGGGVSAQAAPGAGCTVEVVWPA
ncbi:MAG: ATP-binding protein [Burkholderiaceae bacterium]|jgi:light-regulated signal transduction histidine kinase (bacteriophytochrome)|nr:ATP-binding protein [Burkholderiaceae bacterium]